MKIQLFNKKLKLALLISVLFTMVFSSFFGAIYGYPSSKIEITVFFKDNEKCEFSGIEYIHRWENLNGFHGWVTPLTYERLSRSESVEFITREMVIENFHLFAETCSQGVAQVEADRVWGGERSHPIFYNVEVIPGLPAGEGIKVGILDTGIDYYHDDLWDNYVTGADFVDLGTLPLDEGGHGTLCAGVVAAVDNDIDVIGVAPKAQLYALRGIDENPLFLEWAAIVNCIDWAISHDIDIISMSFGAPAYQQVFPQWLAIGLALGRAKDAGIVLVAASGNYPQMPFEDQVSVPACYLDVIAVGACDYDGNRVDGTWSSCYGLYLDFLAPGYSELSTEMGGGTTGFAGTSCAAPHVAGICALLLSQDPTLTPSEIKTILINTAKDVGPAGWDSETGYGVVNAYGACDQENPTVSITYPTSYYVSGTVEIKASTTDNYRVDNVKFKIDSGSWYPGFIAENGWSWPFYTDYYSDGIHTIYCRAYDARGNWAQTQKTVRVSNNAGGGGGCPILYVYNGSEFIEEGLLDIHNPDGIDVVTTHELVTEPKFVKKRCFLRLTEHPLTISHIDKVELYGRLSNGVLIPLALKSALHSSLGNVLPELKFSDDNRVDVLGAIHNNGTSEFIDIEFKSISNHIFSGFTFIIEGHNLIVK